jgi:hypothetical protein
MTGTELVDKLLASGTPPDHLEVARAWSLRQPQGGTPEGVLELLESDPRVNEGTLRKAKGMVGFVDDQAARGFPVRAPAGGASVGGQKFGAGEVIPSALLTTASPDERDQLRQSGGTPGEPANRSTIPPLKSTPVTSGPAQTTPPAVKTPASTEPPVGGAGDKDKK